MTKKNFITLNFHSGTNYLNPAVTWGMIDEFYIDALNTQQFYNASIGVGPFLAYIWKFGNSEWGGNFTGIGNNAIQKFKTYLSNGGGMIYYDTGALSPVPFYPELDEE